MKLAILTALQLIIIVSFAQKTERYNGAFYNGEKIKGNASYTYYRDKDNKQVKDGSFRYSAREKNDKWRYSHSISGTYKDGYKTGKWIYNYSTKDYKQDNEGYFYTINMTLQSIYNNGYPSGKWLYSNLTTKYKKILNKGKYKKVNITNIKDVKITLNWDKNTLIDSLIIKNNIGESIYANFNKEGFFNGEFVFIGDEKEFWQYNNGIPTYKGIDTTIMINKEFKSYNQIKNKDAKVKKIKKSLLNKEGCVIAKYLNEDIFNQDYTLFRYIDGDRIITTDKRTNEDKLLYKGLFFYKLKPILSKKENEVIKTISIYHQRIKQAEWLTNRQILEDPKNTKYKDDKERIVYALNEFKEINCFLKYYEDYLNIENIKVVTENKCGAIKNSILLKTKEDYLNGIYNKAKHQIDILTAYNQFK